MSITLPCPTCDDLPGLLVNWRGYSFYCRHCGRTGERCETVGTGRLVCGYHLEQF